MHIAAKVLAKTRAHENSLEKLNNRMEQLTFDVDSWLQDYHKDSQNARHAGEKRWIFKIQF
ncbi:protein FYV8 [Roseibium sp. TrichSKD4]|uniref:hypothetical protein n=1 Tax=Roseibium sp. TrichSKD4 TaxID=744980 RepID=UPI0001E575E5|nr:hypothetical protein [Roseibium sp. TrichSKD4]EFO30013.1 protein FYV8 [Roseibium sp. TrichSKD4]